MSDLFSRVADPGSAKCAQALALYEAAFPPPDRHPPGVILARIAAGRNQLFVAEEDEGVIFLSLLSPLAGTDFTLLDYLATAPGARGRGWGSQFLQEIFSECRAHQEFVIHEVEDPISETGKNARGGGGFTKRTARSNWTESAIFSRRSKAASRRKCGLQFCPISRENNGRRARSTYRYLP